MIRRVIKILDKGDVSADKMHEYAKRVLAQENIPFMEMHYEEDGFSNEMRGDCLYEEAERIAIENNGVSTATLQRKLHIGYARSANLLDMLEENKIVKSYEDSNGAMRKLADKGEKLKKSNKKLSK